MRFAFLLFLCQNLPGETHLAEYFQHNRTTHGLVLDRESNKEIVSVAATGFGCYVWALSLPRPVAIQYINQAIDTTMSHNPRRNRGWLFHFLHKDGTPLDGSEVSTIDSAIFYLGALRGAEYLNDDNLLQKVRKLIDSVDISYMVDPSTGLFRHGTLQEKYIGCLWDTNSEGIILYRLFNTPFQPRQKLYNLPTFCYTFPCLFFNNPADITELKKALRWQQRTYHRWGFTSCYGPDQYVFFDPNIFSNLEHYAVGRYIGQNTQYSEVPTVCLKTGWQSKERVGVECGEAYILLQKGKLRLTEHKECDRVDMLTLPTNLFGEKCGRKRKN